MNKLYLEDTKNYHEMFSFATQTEIENDVVGINYPDEVIDNMPDNMIQEAINILEETE